MQEKHTPLPTRSISMVVRWFRIRAKWCLFALAMIGLMTVTLNRASTQHVPIVAPVYPDVYSSPPTVVEHFIPDFPNQTTIGKPPDIPRRFLVEEADACLRAGDDVEVVAYVHSAISRVEQRRQTRLSWASAATPKMVVVFMVGRAKNDKEREILRRESELYHDIVQGDYGDHYNLLTYKALNSLYWITRNCAHVPWTLHVDDDLLIDTFLLQQFIDEFNDSDTRDLLHCRLLTKIRVERKGRWKVTKKELAMRRYPPFCQGTVWMIPTKELSRILGAVPSVNYLWVDDAYLTGFVAKKIGLKIAPIPDWRFGIGHYYDEDIGKKFAWFHTGRNHTELWPLLLDHYNATKDATDTS